MSDVELEELISRVTELLNRFEDDHEELEILRPGILLARVSAYQTLCKAREQYRHPKDKDLTDFDRKTMLEASVADIQAHYEAAKGLEELVAERIDLLKLLMRIK